ncbi:MAG TPA: GNAT family N-acetyltransferase [Thermoanaerobaculia bacterium]
MDFRILLNYAEVKDFLPSVQRAADENRSALGFLPASVYQQSAMQSKLWVATSLEGNRYLGHLLFGGTYPYLKITQVFVAPDQRNGAVGSRLIQELIAYGEKYNYISVSARVAADLPANRFWEHLGFQCAKQVAGGKTTRRMINLRVRFLDVPLLFEKSELQTAPYPGSSANVGYESKPVMGRQDYALDINSLLDLLRHRKNYEAVSAMIRAGFNHIVSLVLTSEAREELRRQDSTMEQSPALEFLSQLPVLPRVNDLTELVNQLRLVVFPRRSRDRKGHVQDTSDLLHIASCVHYRLAGFVTSERAILRAAQAIKSQFAIDILSPLEFLDPEFGTSTAGALLARAESREVGIQDFEEQSRGEIEIFLERVGVPQEERCRALHPGATGHHRRRFSALVDGELVAFSSWSAVTRFRPELDFFLYADESLPLAQRVIEHLLEIVSREARPVKLCGINLFHGPDQLMTRRVAIERGFRSRDGRSNSKGNLFKASASGFVSEVTWGSFAAQFQSITGLGLPAQMPGFEEVSTSGISMRRPKKGDADLVGLIDFETLTSPGAFLFPGRPGAMIPIRQRFAEDLLGSVGSQMSFLPGKEALLRVEKAYFRSPQGSDALCKGTPVVFYISGHGRGLKQAIGCARITSSAVVPIDDALVQYSRQGVLGRRELEAISKKGKIHVFTFDNWLRFPQPLEYGSLKDLNCIGAANLVTVQRLDHEQLLKILSAGFSNKAGVHA